jgi:16S rRNA (uracil1498-N3)-methyltransferase
MERFYVAPEEMGIKDARITGEEFKHLSHVLRLKAGSQIEVFDGKGRGFCGVLEHVGQAEALVVFDAPVTQARESPLCVCLAQGIPKGDRMEWIVQKATELGVDSVLPLELSRCVVRLEGERKRRDRQARWRKVALEAAKQSGRLKIPDIMYPLALDAFLKLIRPGDRLLIPWEEGGQPLRAYFAGEGHFAGIGDSVHDKIPAPPGNPGFTESMSAARAPVGETVEMRVFIMIGPEGGMTEEEVEAGRKAGGKVLTLGPRILRTDTAGLMLLSVLQAQWGDMG